MQGFLIFVLVLLLVAVLAVLGRGVYLMATGRDTGGVKQNKAMRSRVLLQAAAIFVAMLILALARGG